MQKAVTSAGPGALLAIDAGSTWLKVSAFAPDGTLLGGGRRAQPTRVSADGARREQDPEDWWQLSRALIDELTASGAVSPAAVLGISVTGRGASPVFLDAAGEPVCPTWMDRRSAADEAEARRSAASLGLPTNSYAMGLTGRLAWLKREQPETFARVRGAIHLKDYLVYRLTGALVTDPASGPDADEWPLPLFSALAVDSVTLPEVRPGWSLAGRLAGSAARDLGLPAGLPVAVGVHDGVAANIGVGAVQDGDAALTLGTHAVIRGVVMEVAPGARRFYGLLPGRVCVGGNALQGGRSVDWFLDATAGGEEREAALAKLEREGEDVPPGSRGVAFLPFLGGSVSPHVRPAARGAFLGLSVDAGQAVLYRAVLEGVAFALRAIRDELAGWDVRPADLRLTGGGARSGLWRQILADVLELPVVPTPDFAEGRGVAVCLAVALGCYPSVDAAAREMVALGPPVLPSGEVSRVYAELYGRYRRLADAVYAVEETA